MAFKTTFNNGKEIKKWRKEHNIKQKTLAAALNYSVWHFNRIENGSIPLNEIEFNIRFNKYIDTKNKQSKFGNHWKKIKKDKTYEPILEELETSIISLTSLDNIPSNKKEIYLKVLLKSLKELYRLNNLFSSPNKISHKDLHSLTSDIGRNIYSESSACINTSGMLRN